MIFFSNIAYLAAAQGIFLSLVLFFIQRGNRAANFFLATFIFCFSLWIAEFAAWFTDDLYQFPHLLFTTTGLPLLFGPFLLFYAVSLTDKHPLTSKRNYFHFLPFLLHIVYLSPFLFQSAAAKQEELRLIQNIQSPPDFSIVYYINESLKFLQLLIYLYLIFHFYLKNKSTSLSAIYQLNWLKILWIGLGLFAVFDLSYLLGLYLFQYDYLFVIAQTILLFGALLTYYIGYATLRQPEIFVGQLTKKKTTARYEKSTFDSANATRYLQQLIQKMELEKLYLNNNLKLTNLAQSIDLSTHHLSQLLNEHLQKNYFDFVNEYRVKEAQKMLANPDFKQYTILSIAYDSGFKNKASFNTAFKKHTGLTPSQYKKQFFIASKE